MAAPSMGLPRALWPGLHRGLHVAQTYLRPCVRLAVKAASLLLALLTGIVVLLVVAYRWVNPPISTLMLGQAIAGTAIERTWVPLKRVSPHLVRAVVMSEDGRFCSHGGVDWPALQDAITHDRGGSTITMQVVKNLFLWPSRSYVRKFIEIALAYLVDGLWSKERILEIYLNIAEWGDGVFGAEAAARFHFSKSAAELTAEEAALLAVALPSPLERTPGYPTAGTSRLAERLLRRMSTSKVELACLASGASSAPKAPVTPVSRPTPKEKLEKAAPKGAPKPSRKEERKEGEDVWDHLFRSED